MELSEIIPGKNLTKPICTLSEGEAPQQIITVDEVKPEKTSEDFGEQFYGDESFDLDELDIDGFDGLEEIGDTD